MTVAPGADSDAGEVRVRPAERADLLAVHRIERAAFPTPWPFEAFERFVGEPGFLVAVEVPTEGTRPAGGRPTAEEEEGGGATIDDAGVLGYVVAEVTPNHGRAFGHVKDLAVHPDHRRRGVASTLLERAIVTMAGQGAASVKLEVRAGNDAARRLYRSFRFAPMRRRPGYYDDGEDAIVLSREL